jgi:threonine dehydrogenase-like Zn-dependent dehydrogenase
VRTVHSGISRGTELLVHRGGVPPDVADQMRAPFQEGDLPGPVKYGYLSVGVVEAGPEPLVGRTTFCLYPHQDRYVVPASALTPVPDAVPPRRAVLAGTVETAVNAVWDAAPRLGDRIAVIGAGMVGCSVAALLRAFPLGRLQLLDVDPRRRAVADRLGVPFVDPAEAAGDCDLVVHCSATGAGLARGRVTVQLGGAFHARRLSVRASQVGAVAASRRTRRTHADRLALAMDVLADPVFDALITGSSPFTELPETMRRLADGELDALCHVIDYPGATVATAPEEA